MNIKQNSILRLWTVFLLCLCALPSCGKLELESIRRDREIIIDGKYSDWGNMQAYYDEKEKLVVNLCNDQDYLYICLISRNRKIEAELMESGFMVWFDPEGGKGKTFGIRFPIGMKNMGMSITENEKKSREYRDELDTEGRVSGQGNRWADKDFAKKLETLEGLQDKIEIVTAQAGIKGKDGKPQPKDAGQDIAKGRRGPGKDFIKGRGIELSLEESARVGIEAKMGHENGYFVYEIKVPLIKSPEHPYAIELRTDKTIGLGLEVDKSMMMGGMERPMPPGMSGGGAAPERFQLWASVAIS